MLDTVMNFLNGGLLHAGWLFKVIYFLIVTQLTIFAVTLYLHRSACHRGVDFHPVVTHVLRLWTWLSTGMITREWVAVHRKHHAKCETEEDPHSPKFFGVQTVLWKGVDLYRVASLDEETLEKYGKGCPDDWIERHVYSAHAYWGPTLTFIINIALFGIWGLAISALQMIWIPFWAAGVVNGIGHWWGYRNFETSDMATNLSPWGVWIGGEELHNNHHAFPSSAKFALRTAPRISGSSGDGQSRPTAAARAARQLPAADTAAAEPAPPSPAKKPEQKKGILRRIFGVFK